MEIAFASRDPKPLDDAMDPAALVDRALAGLKGSKASTERFTEMVSKSYKPGTVICDLIGKTGAAKLLRVKTRGGDHTTAIFRCTGALGLNYMEVVLALEDGAPRVVDVFNYVAGEPSSTTLRRSVAPLMAAEKDKAKTGSLTPEEKEYLDAATQYKEFGDRTKAQEWKQALDVYAQLPESMRKQPAILLARARAATSLKDAAAIAASDADLEKYCGKNPLMALALVDPCVRRKDLKAALACMDLLDDSVGGDDQLLLFRARIAFRLDDTKAAREFADTFIKTAPNDKDGYWLLVDISLKEKAWGDTVKALRAIEKLGIPLKDLTTVPVFAEFVKTKEFEDWRASHPPKK
jgi:hypothetical protein